MDEGKALLRAVCEFPGEDTPRLVFADWLDEHALPRRAEFIRDTLGAWPVVNDFAPELLALVPGMTRSGFGKEDDADGGRPYWRFGLPGAHTAKFVFSRGFVSRIELPCADFFRHAAAIFSAHPVTSVRLTDVRPGTTDRDPGFKNYYCWEARWNSKLWPLVYTGHLKCGLDSWRDTEEECGSDLSAACVAHGRNLAGLTPLPVPERRARPRKPFHRHQ